MIIKDGAGIHQQFPDEDLGWGTVNVDKDFQVPADLIQKIDLEEGEEFVRAEFAREQWATITIRRKLMLFTHLLVFKDGRYKPFRGVVEKLVIESV